MTSQSTTSSPMFPLHLMAIFASPSQSRRFPFGRHFGSSAPSAIFQSYLSNMWQMASFTSCAAKKRPGQAWWPYPNAGKSAVVVTS